MFNRKKRTTKKGKTVMRLSQEKPLPAFLRSDYPYQAGGDIITDVDAIEEGVLYEIKCRECEMSIRSQGKSIKYTYELLMAGGGCIGCRTHELVVKRVVISHV